MRSRDIRRHHHERAVRKCRNFSYKDEWYKKNYPEEYEKGILKTAENRKKCSCDMCCNPRRSPWSSETAKMTIQERRAKELDFRCDSVYD